jgi:hypothetical protein
MLRICLCKIRLVGMSKSVGLYCAYKLSGMCIIIIYRRDSSTYVRKESRNNKYSREFVVQEEKGREFYLLITKLFRRIPSSGMWRRVALVCTDVTKRRFTQDLHGATSQKTPFFIVTAVKTSNLTKLFRFGDLYKMCLHLLK